MTPRAHVVWAGTSSTFVCASLDPFLVADRSDWEGDVGGQKTLRTYWRNYFEKTDALIWVVDAADRLRTEDCRKELAGLLLEERLMGASLLVFSNKTDIEGSMNNEEIRKTIKLQSVASYFAKEQTLILQAMAMDDGSEDVNDFLLRIRELGDRRDREDEERTRKLEEEILQGRKERQARRAERARSISPTKEQSSNGGTPTSVGSTANSTRHEDMTRSPVISPALQASLGGTVGDRSDTSHEVSKRRRSSPPRDLPHPPSKPPTLSTTSSSPATALSRAGTLSWQQRPISRGSSGPRARPLSQVAAENSASRSPRASVEPPSKEEPELSKDTIAESLGSKDPAWFRQTQERGLGSAAYRRNQDEPMLETASMTGSFRLPGMSREPTREPERQGSPASESIRAVSPRGGGSIRGEPSKYSTSASVSSSKSLRSPLPIMNSHIFEPPPPLSGSSKDKDTLSTSEKLTAPLSQGRISSERLERSPSPTKGLGGFVQSAMLKRSDSVNKRWSAQPGTGLSRGNSIASNRSGYEASRYGIASLNTPQDGVPSRDPSPVASSRPDSSHNPVNLIRPGHGNTRPDPDHVSDSTNTGPTESLIHSSVKPEAPQENSHLDIDPDPPARTRTKSETSPPSSPNKRWSPTKPSWLENAINKPDSPKPKMPPPQQPSWMANLNQAKQQRAAAEPGKSSSFKEVSTGGLLRSPPMGAATNPYAISGLKSRPNATAFELPRTNSFKGASAPEDQKIEPHNDLETSRDMSPQSRTEPTTDVSEAITSKTASTTSTPSKALKGVSTDDAAEKGTASPQLPKPKPETPPKKDLRSNLKPRQVSGERKSAEQAEFKNVFGKLKRTQTQNYVAPDELKDNILRGKAGLSVTGGPKKTERRDEFKESLLKQKEAMKTGHPSATGRKPSTGSAAGDDQTSAQPAASVDGRLLIKSDSSSKNLHANFSPSEAQPEALAGLQRLKQKPRPTPSEPLLTPPTMQQDPTTEDNQGLNFNTSLAGMLARGPSPLAATNRSTPKAVSGVSEAELGRTTGSVAATAAEGPQLTHMTKTRARGPKRRLPTNRGVEADTNSRNGDTLLARSLSSSEVQGNVEPKASVETLSVPRNDPKTRPLVAISNNHRKPSQPQPPRKPSINIKKADISKTQPSNAQNSPDAPQPRSPPSTKPKPLSSELSQPPKPSISVSPHSGTTSSTSRVQKDEKKSTDTITSSISRSQSSPNEASTPPSVQGAAATWGPKASGEKPFSIRTKPPVKPPTLKDKEAAPHELLPKGERPVGLGIDNNMQLHQASAPAQHDLPTPPLSSPQSPPMPAKKSITVTNRIISNGVTSQPASKVNGSPIPQTSEAARLFAELFDESPNNDLKVNIDTPAVLSSRAPISEANKIRTLRKQLWEVTAGGKLIPVASGQSHILFEESLYICHHVFGSLSGTRTTEVYLWCGDGVAVSAVEDAQIFARKEAKDHGGKLIVLAQGKETPNFFQALGGIVITRHGQSDRASSHYMLCGRRHMGQIAFDEVEFSSRSLCSGFPYLISSGSGKVHLWKGSGSGVDELGCARLIGMDLGVRGEIEEVEDGSEPDSFWKCFPTGQQQSPTASNDTSLSKRWRLKPSCQQYVTRMYRVDIEAPRPKSSSGFMWGRRGSAPASEENAAFTAQIKEVVPFAQSDVFNDGVFVLDIFFEIFV
ncbi:MAG: hypothetical protein Q9200_005686, partial [Gallowayella weberi]